MLRPLSPDEVRIYRLGLAAEPAGVARCRSVLSGEELARVGRLFSASDRTRFVVARGTLRILLAGFTGERPSAVELGETDQGKPVLAGASAMRGIHFNLSHSGATAAIAVTRGRPIGVDIEQLRERRSMTAIIDRFLAPEERAALERLPRDRKLEAFFNCWTRKEACLKASGQSIFAGRGGLVVPVESAAGSMVVRDESGPGSVLEWRVETFSPAPGYVGAVASVNDPWRVQIDDWIP